MKNIRFDISPRRFHPLWLIIGAVIGRALGLILGLNLHAWYFATTSALIEWQIFGAIVCALFVSFLMTSRAIPQLKYALLGIGIGFAFATYTGEMWTVLQSGRDHGGLAGMTVDEGIFFDWLLTHIALFGAIIGLIACAVISRRHKKPV